MKVLLLLSLALVASAGVVEKRSYSGYRVLSVHSRTQEDFELLKSLQLSDVFDFWTPPVKNGIVDIMVGPQQIEGISQQLKGMKFEVKVEDVERLIAEEKASQGPKAATGKIAVDRYNSYDEIVEWMSTLKDSSAIVASVTPIGQSYEKRDLYAVKFSNGDNAGKPKPAVFIDANIHAREWITSATAVWLMNDMVTKPDAYTPLLDKIDIYIVPMVNPDGYEYARTTDRMWRKTRSVNAGSSCRGCDPNRNWSFQFGGESTSASPCSDLFHGPSAFSESETKAVSDHIISLEASGVKFGAYMTFHSYGQYWLLPWGYTAGVYPPDYPENLALGTAAEKALSDVYGTRYLVGQGADALYGVGGASDDWAKDHGVKYTVTVEMRDEGRYGFVLPATQIIPNAQEILEAVKVYCNKVAEELGTH